MSTTSSSLNELVARAAYGVIGRLPAPSPLADRVQQPGTYETHALERVRIPRGDDFIPGSLFTPRERSGGTVLLLHGALTYALPPYAHCIEALLARGLRVLAIELDGHGENPRAFAPTAVAENAPTALRWLMARPDVDAERVGAMGVSLGGACALHAATEVERLKAVVTVCTPLSLRPAEALQQVVEFTSGVVTPGGIQMLATMPAKHLMAFLDEAMRVAGDGPRELHMLDPRTPLLVNEAVQRLDPLACVARLGDRPYLAIHGEWDTVAPAAHARTLHAAAPGPSELLVSPMRNHFTIMWCPRAMGAAADWFTRHL